jgi:hypothetical protein
MTNAGSVTLPFTFTATGTCGGTVTATLALQDGTNNLGTVVFTLPLGVTGTFWSENFDTVTAPALPVGWSTSAGGSQSAWVTTMAQRDTLPNAVFSPAPTTAGSNALVSAAVTLPAGPVRLTFKHRYELESNYDGGVLEIKIGAGAFTDILTAGGAFVSGGYTSTLGSTSGNPLGGRQAWSGTNATFTPVVVNLPAAAAGQTVQFRWRCGTDNSFAKAGWWVDSVAVTGVICCGDVIAPVILTQPQGTNVVGGSPVNFWVGAFGSAPLGYQWFLNTNALTGATATNYFIASAVAMNAGNYFVVITNVVGSVTSAVAPLTVTVAPVILQSPVGQGILIGQPANLAVTAIGAPTLAYQWRKDGVNLAGANATNYFIASVAAGDAGSYDVVVTNFSGSVTSGIAVLTALAPTAYSGIIAGWDFSPLAGGVGNFGPSPFAAKTNAPNVAVGGLTRGAGVATPTGTTAAARAWGGTGFSSTSATAAVTANQYASFVITVSNGYQLSFSQVSQLDYRRSSSGPAGGILQYQVGNGAFTDITTLSYSSSANGGASLGPIDLSAIAALQNVAAGTNVTFRIVNWNGSSGGTWYLYDKSNTTADDLEITGSLMPVVVTTPPPVITVPPVDTNVFVGKNAGFSVTASGNAPLNFQWLKNGTSFADAGAVSGARTNVLNFTPAATNHAGSYSVIVTNLGGAVTSSVALLNVAPLPTLVFSNSGGGLVLGADGGAVSNAYIIQSATDLVPPIVWTPLLTNVIGTNGQIRFTETNYNLPASFYRIMIP